MHTPPLLWPSRLAVRLPLVAVVIFVLTMTLHTALTIQEQTDFQLGTRIELARALAAQTADRAADALHEGRAALDRLVLDTALHPHTLLVHVVDTAGVPLAGAESHGDAAQLSAAVNGERLSPPSSSMLIAEPVDGGESGIVDIWAPIGREHPLGWVRLHYRIGSAAELRQHIWTRALILVTIASLLAGILLWLMLRRPLNSIARAATLARDLDTRRGEVINIGGSVEIVELGAALNQVSARLASDEMALKASQERTEALLRHAVDGIVTLDAEGHIERFNQAAEHLFGYPARQAIGCNISLLLPQVRAGEAFRNRALNGRRRDGALIPLEVSVGEARLGDGNRLYVAILRDLSARDLAERALADSELRKAAILQAALDAIVSIDSRGRVLEFNPAAERLFGYPLRAVIGRDVAELIVPERGRMQHRLGLARYLETGASDILGTQRNVTAMRSDGSEVPVEILVTPVHLESGPMFVAYIRDMRERQAAERALRASDERYQRVVDSLHEAIFQADARGRLTFLNRAWSEISGYDPATSLGRSLDEFIESDDRANYRAALKQTALDANESRVEVRLRRHDSKSAWVEIAIEYTAAGHELEAGFTGTISDINARKAVETELLLARDAAEAASRTKSEFLATMSHELRTPLNAIIGMTEIARETVRDPEVRDYLTTAHSAANRLLGIINDLLDFSTLESGPPSVRSVPFSLRQHIHASVALHARGATAKGLELIAEVEPNVPDDVSGDPDRLAQVVSKLVGNAVKFTERGEIAVRIRLQELDEQAVGLLVSVRDTGIGIAADKLSRVFQPFVQAEASFTRHYGGTGLGLSIAQRLVELMGGRIHVESTLGAGSEFFFTLRLQRTAAAASEAVREPDWSGLFALVIDDNASSRSLLERQLRYWGWQTVAATSADEALELLRERTQLGHPFDLLLLDESLPFHTVEHICNELARAKHPPPIILLRAAGLDGDDTQPAAVSSCLVKPVDSARLRSAIEHLLTPMNAKADD